MSLLLYSDGETFATGAIIYQYAPATPSETTNRLVLTVAVENVITQAIVDTGAPYPIIAPRVARNAGLDRLPILERITMLVRGMRLEGGLIRVTMTLIADEGDDLDVPATAFIPDAEEYWGNFPSFIGQIGFLERICYAVNPSTNTFYFGPLS
ncbi:retroviral-like aspartic protease family protein [Argonema galeatum]|uniref:retroviral-like aspartic protease family protein n=1 Tax=Argonema galeatum TaxID=2942762 RepID=UPI0020123A93|nr:retroviral-like aspartic protease family protein [Argonema galeatum]MCL1465632.1 retroviral-like aspartic protease family protein [Argonema galeatum A003/A1]